MYMSIFLTIEITLLKMIRGQCHLMPPFTFYESHTASSNLSWSYLSQNMQLANISDKNIQLGKKLQRH